MDKVLQSINAIHLAERNVISRINKTMKKLLLLGKEKLI